MAIKLQPKTIEEWREERLKKAKQEKGYILIPMELWNGEAFHSLSKSEKLILLECLSQLRYAPKSNKKRQNIPQEKLLKTELGWLLNKGEFGLPTKYLQERGIKGEDTIANAKKKLVGVGFLDVVIQGNFSKAARFRYSDRWRTYNSSSLSSVKGEPAYDGPMPGYCLHPNIVNYNVKRKKTQHCPGLEHEHSMSHDESVQLDLFDDYVKAA